VGFVEEGRQEVRGEEGETKEVTLATAFSENQTTGAQRADTNGPTGIIKCRSTWARTFDKPRGAVLRGKIDIGGLRKEKRFEQKRNKCLNKIDARLGDWYVFGLLKIRIRN
jgi:hypothetical protein